QFGMENNRPDGDGVVCGLGTIDGKTVAVYGHDFTVLGGSLAEANGRKIVKVQKLALKLGCPIIGINDSGGARIQEAWDRSPCSPRSSASTSPPPASSRRSR